MPSRSWTGFWPSGEKKVTVTLLQELLGMPDRDLVSGSLTPWPMASSKAALERADELAKRGRSPGISMLETLLERFRDLMVLAACGPETELVELSVSSRQEENSPRSPF
jgi:hypothetical protein